MPDLTHFQKIREEEKKIRNAVKVQLGTAVVAALGLVAGLAWNDAVKSLIIYIFPTEGGGIIPQFMYAILVTLFVAILSYFISKWLAEKKPDIS